MYSEIKGANLFASVKSALNELFADYVVVYQSINVSGNQSQSS